MMHDESTLSEEELFRRIAMFLFASPPEEEVDDILREAGYDPDEIGVVFQSLAEEALASSPLNWRNNTAEMNEARSRLRAMELSLPSDRPSLLERIHTLMERLGSRSQTLAVQYRNLHDVSDADLRTLLADLEHLEEEER
jgi:hypothetical protein